MTFGAAISSVYKNYATFNGRSRRSEYWYFFLFYLIVDIVLQILMGIGGANNTLNPIILIVALISVIFGLGSLIPSLAVGARRLHDTNRSGWWLLLYLLPVIGWIILLIWMCTPGTTGPNKFGADPKVATPATVASVF